MLVLLAWLLAAPVVANAADLATEGVCAYATGRFGEAATVLRRAVDDARTDRADFGLRAYFLGRALRELGLGGFALRWLRAAEETDRAPWRELARREEAELHFESGNRAPLRERFGRIGADADPEIAYLVGLAAAQQFDWTRAVEILGRVPSSSRFYLHARYARAQAAAADGSFDAALEDLSEVLHRARPPKDPPRARLTDRELLHPLDAESGMLRLEFVASAPAVALRDRAALLRGKILYLRGNRSQARAAFGLVAGSGPTRLEALRGLMLTGGVSPSAQPAGRTVDASALLMASAAGAAQRGDVSAEWRRRVSLRDLVHARLSSLERLASDTARRAALERDLAEFGLRLRRARARSRWLDEESVLPIPCTLVPWQADGEAFHPSDEIFYGIWERSQVDPRGSAALNLLGDSRALAADLAAPFQRRPFWEVWRAGEDERLHYALLVARVASLRLRRADYAWRFAGSPDEDHRARRREALESAIRQLEGLYLGTAPNHRATRLSTEKSATIEHRGKEILEAAEAAGGDSTDALIELLSGYVDALGGHSVKRERRESDVSGFGSGLVVELRAQNGSVMTDSSRWVQGLIENRRLAEVRFFERVEADNQGALSRVYARMNGEAE